MRLEKLEVNLELEKMKFEEFKNKNPRQCIPDTMKEFLEFAKKEYKNFDDVNCTYSDDLEEHLDEVESYIGECMEALLLYKKFANCEVKE